MNIETNVLDCGSYFKDQYTKKRIFVLDNRINKKSAAAKVVYAFDGQNIFLSGKDFKCHAQVSLNLEDYFVDDYIIVGIDCSEGEIIRNRQLTMSESFGSLTVTEDYDWYKDGLLQNFGLFLTENIIEFINQKYKIAPKKEDTYILGASSGGLAALYLGLNYSHIFGNIISLSPATGLFYCADWKRFFTEAVFRGEPNKLFIYCGKDTQDRLEEWLYCGDGEKVLSASKIKSTLTFCGYKNCVIKEDYKTGALHNEFYWRQALLKNKDFILDL